MHVVLAGGGTAGHIEPALALADALRRRDAQIGITALGTARGLETRLVPARGYDLVLIPPVPLPRRLTLAVIGVPRRVAAAVAETGRVLDRVGADVVVGFGGYVAAPAYLAARRRGITIVVHEANARPGLANRLGARLSHHVVVSTAGSALPGAVFLGLPLRRTIATLDRAALRTKARAELGLDPEAPTLLVTGGSQGARRVNTAAAGTAAVLTGAGVQVLHATGPAQSVQVSPAPGGAPYIVVPYLDRMDLAYAAADLALCRAGAMTVAELTAVGLPAAYVPLPIGNGEQRLNAEPVARASGGLVVADADCTPQWVEATVLPLLLDPARLAAMGAAAAVLGRRDADETLADLVLSVVGVTGGSAIENGRGAP